MMKKTYVKPETGVVKVDIESQLLGDSKANATLPEVTDGGDAFQPKQYSKRDWFGEYED